MSSHDSQEGKPCETISSGDLARQESSSKQAGRAAVTYERVATEDPHKAHKERRKLQLEQGNWGVQLVDDIRFQNFIGLIIVMNGLVIGFETDLPDAMQWSEIENGFLVFFMCELILKLWAEGKQFFAPDHPDFLWNMFDGLVIGIGVADALMYYFGTATAGGFGNFVTIFRMVRLMRILRLFRLLKFLRRLYMLVMGLVEASKAIFWVTILMCFVLYVCAIVLVKTIGRTPSSDPHYDFLHPKFDNIPACMITLFVLMSSPNLPIYQDELGLLETRPYFTMFLIVFITFGSFGMLAMLTGVINESMFENNELRKTEQREQHEQMRAIFCEECSELFQDIPINANGEATIEDVKRKAPELLELLENSGAHIAHGDICKFIENIDVDDSGTISILEFVQAMEKVAEGLNPLGMLEVEKAVGHCTRTLQVVEQRITTMLASLETSESSNKQMLDRIKGEEDGALKTAEAINDHLMAMDVHMEKLFQNLAEHEDRVQSTITDQLGQTETHVQRLLAQMGDTEAKVEAAVARQVQRMEKVESTVEQAVSQQIQELTQLKSETGGGALQNALSNSLQALQKDGTGEASLQRIVSQETGSIRMHVQKLAEQVDTTEQRLQLTVHQQLGEIRRAVQLIVERRSDSPERLNPALSQQIQDLTKSLQSFMDQVGKQSLPQQLEVVDRSVQKVLEQWRAIGNEASLNSVVSRHVEEIHKSVQKFLDQKDNAESRLQLAVSSQIQDIATAVQKLLHEKESRDSARDSARDNNTAIAALESSVCGKLSEMNASMQRQNDATQAQLMRSVSDVGQILLKSVSDVLAKNSASIQQECSTALRGVLAEQDTSKAPPLSGGGDRSHFSSFRAWQPSALSDRGSLTQASGQPLLGRGP